MTRKLTIWYAAACFAAAGQTQLDLYHQVNPATKPVKIGAALPAACLPGDLFLLTPTTAGNTNLYACLTQNVWTAQQGVAGSLTVESNGTLIGSEPVQNVIGASGILNTISDTGSRFDMVAMIDPAVVQTHTNFQSGRDLLCQSQSGSNQSYTCSMTPSLTAYQAGMLLDWIPDAGSAGLAATLAIDGLPAITVTMPDGITIPPVGSITAGQLQTIWYDGNVFRLITTGGAAQTSATRDIMQQFYLGGTPLTSGMTYYQSLSFGCTITQWKLLADQGGSATVKVWKTANGVFPTSAASISVNGLASGNSFSTTLSDLTTTQINAGDNLAFYLSAVSGGTQQAALTLECQQ